MESIRKFVTFLIILEDSTVMIETFFIWKSLKLNNFCLKGGQKSFDIFLELIHPMQYPNTTI